MAPLAVRLIQINAVRINQVHASMRGPTRSARTFSPQGTSPADGEKFMSMQTSLMAGAAVALTAALATPAAQAQLYLGGEGGWTGLEGTKTSIAGVPINQSFDGGFNVGARAGYQMGPWRFEGEYSHRENGSNLTRFGTRLNGTLDTDSFMANAIYDFNVGWLVTPHIGMGIGATELNGNLNGPAIGYRSKTSDAVFSYQAIAGARYMINPTLAFDLDYRYRGSADATYHARAFTVGGVTVPARTYTGSANTNNVVASLTYLFGAAPPPPPPMPPPPPVMAPPPAPIVEAPPPHHVHHVVRHHRHGQRVHHRVYHRVHHPKTVKPAE
jgi:opacity protein-like surface antigen